MELTMDSSDIGKFIVCSTHPTKERLLWCKTCDVMVCLDCMEDEHDGHSIRKLRKHLVEKIETDSKKPVHEVILENCDSLSRLVASKTSELEALKHRVSSIENGIALAEKQKSKLEDISNSSKAVDAEDPENDLSVLFCLSESSLQKTILSYFSGSSEQNMISRSTETENVYQISVHCSAQPSISCFAAQTESLLKSSSTQTETSSICLATQTEVEKTLLSFENIADSSTPISCSRSSLTDLEVSAKAKAAQPSTQFVEGLADCGCLLRHNPDPPLHYPIAIIGLLRVIQRNPLVLDNSNDLIICPFQFWISGEVVPHKEKKSVKMLRLAINCCHVYDDDDRLPPTVFKFGFTLNNNLKNEPDKEKEGYWSYPNHKWKFWYPLSVGELLNQRKGWIDRDNDIVVTLELKL